MSPNWEGVFQTGEGVPWTRKRFPKLGSTPVNWEGIPQTGRALLEGPPQIGMVIL